ncbi:MAG: hypothetical protein ACXWZX_14220 [Mycobacterium sp.]
MAEAIKAHVAGKGEPQPFRYRNRGKLATVGRKAAVIAFGRLRLNDGLCGGSGAIRPHLLLDQPPQPADRRNLIVATHGSGPYLTFERGMRLITRHG